MVEPALQLIEGLRTSSLAMTAFWSLVVNLFLFGLTLLTGHILVGAFKLRLTSPAAPPVTRREGLLAASCVALNTLITVLGIALWQRGVIIVTLELNPWVVARDVLIFFFAMDFAMYVLHRVAHHRWIYPIVHRTHHLYENPRPLTLFVLNPFETLSFGLLWLAVIWVYPATWLGMAIYLAINLAFGLMGHLGVEPMPRHWTRWPFLRMVSTTTFHCEHHRDKSHNYGFYTLIWDRLFKTVSPAYEEDFNRATKIE